MGKPDAPDPRETAAAQTSTSLGTSIANSFLGNVNQVTPDGTLNFDQTGSYDWKDPYTGKTYKVPTFTSTQTLSEQQQKIKDQNDSAKLNLGTLANNQSAFLNDYLGKPVDLSAEAIDRFSNTHFDDDFNKQWDTNRTSLETDLANRGVRMGDDAYNKAIEGFDTRKAGAWDNLQGSNFDRAQRSILTERNQPINEITALLSGSQVSQPNWVDPNTNPMATTDVAGLINSNYENELGSWNDMMGGLFGLGGKAIGAF